MVLLILQSASDAVVTAAAALRSTSASPSINAQLTTLYYARLLSNRSAVL